MIGIVTSDINNLYKTLRCIVFGSVGRLELPTTESFIIKLKGEEVLVSDVGCQKVEMSKNITEINSVYPMSVILQAVNGASLDSSALKIGDIGIAESAIQYDIDFTSLGYSFGHIDSLKQDILKTDSDLRECAVQAANDNNLNYKFGRVISGDKFIESKEEASILKAKFNADFLDTGSSPVLEMAKFYKVPAMSFVGISNYADDNASNDYYKYKDNATIRALECAINLAKRII